MMHKINHEKALQLSHFGEFLLRRKLVPEKNARYFVHWVRCFLEMAPVEAVGLADRIDLFLEAMKGEGREDWQVEQARRALQLYFHNYQKDTDWRPRAASIMPDANGRFSISELTSALRTRMRTRHYAYSTEKTYCEWADRFFVYAREVDPAPDGAGGVRIEPGIVKDFMAWLATRRRVGASTQNQAFNALLFLCREVLALDLGDLAPGVRAKRGVRLHEHMASGSLFPARCRNH